MKTYVLGAIRKAIILTIGLPLLIVGLVLIPAPGPGLPVVALALLILSIEFEIARKQLEQVKGKVTSIYNRSLDTYNQKIDKL